MSLIVLQGMWAIKRTKTVIQISELMLFHLRKFLMQDDNYPALVTVFLLF